SEDFDTFVMENDDGDILGVATLVFRDAIIQGKTEKIGYGTDLQVVPTRLATQAWPELFLPSFVEAVERRNCKYTFSVINFSQSQAMNALLRPRAQRRDIPRYYLLKRFEVVGLHARSLLPQGNPLNTVKVSEGTTEDLEPL